MLCCGCLAATQYLSLLGRYKKWTFEGWYFSLIEYKLVSNNNKNTGCSTISIQMFILEDNTIVFKRHIIYFWHFGAYLQSLRGCLLVPLLSGISECKIFVTINLAALCIPEILSHDVHYSPFQFLQHQSLLILHYHLFSASYQ